MQTRVGDHGHVHLTREIENLACLPVSTEQQNPIDALLKSASFRFHLRPHQHAALERSTIKFIEYQRRIRFRQVTEDLVFSRGL